jgi:putative phosphoribosyl transferase
VVLIEAPRRFLAVGEWYRDFDQVSDEEVVAMLREAGA